MQPLCQILERVDREVSAGLAPEFATLRRRCSPADAHAIMTFRLGYPTAAGRRGLGGAAADVVLT